ncbi:MAG TPA: hypothetical protein VLV87_04450 [Gammaproteobacteria bacterium]|nr:hypothetical protein [Gammaproteobacteria bacterium]
MQIVFYDQQGNAIAYSEDGEHVFLFGGEPIAYLDADAVYSYRGELLGWFEEGWLRDKDGRCVAFSEHAVGGPPRPLKKSMPHQSPRLSNPVKEHQDPRALRPIHSNAWSAQSARDFFSRSPLRWPGGLGAKTN